MKSAFPLTCSLINEKRMSQLSKSLVVLECAENNKEIRNTDYQQLKKDLGYVIENAFDKGDIMGGYYYHVYFDSPEKNKLRVFSMKDIEKRIPKTASVEFWGGEKDLWS